MIIALKSLLGWLSGQLITEQRLPQTPGTSKSLGLGQEALCTCWDMSSTLSQAVDNFALVFPCAELGISQSESLGPPQVFPEHAHNTGNAHSPERADSLLDSRGGPKRFKLQGTCYALAFSFKLFGYLLPRAAMKSIDGLCNGFLILSFYF